MFTCGPAFWLQPAAAVAGFVTPDTAGLSLTSYSPSVFGWDTTVVPGASSLSITSYAPSLLLDMLVSGSTGTLTLTGNAPTIALAQSVSPGAGALALTGFSPAVALSGDVLLQLRFEGATLDVDEENNVRTNTFHTNGSPTLSSTSPMFGSGCMDIDAASTDENLVVTGSNFRASTTSDFTFEFWFYPISEGAAQAPSAAVLRHAIVTFCSSYPVTSGNTSVFPYIWWNAASGGTIGWANGGSSVTGVSANTWHHVAYVIRGANGVGSEFSIYVDGARARVSGNPANNFNTIYIGNMQYGGSLLDGSSANYLVKARFDSIRFTANQALYTGATYTVPTSDFSVP